ncbi:hypothetical protein [Streptomyces sp. NPDC091259]|uniref:hypothetical protein n=1 Tax=Streptomyces sp. NPDC091259 TaxID=3365976 RepID=UPI003800453E
MRPLTLDFENLHLTDGTNHRMLLYTAPADSPSDAALRMLTSLTAGVQGPAQDRPRTRTRTRTRTRAAGSGRES